MVNFVEGDSKGARSQSKRRVEGLDNSPTAPFWRGI